MAVPNFSPYAYYIDSAAQRFGVKPDLIRTVMALENAAGKPTLTSPAGAVGLMQVMPPTYAGLAKQHGLGDDITDPENNINAGSAYLREMLDKFGGDTKLALAAYNAGPTRVALNNGDVNRLPAETREYLRRAAQMGAIHSPPSPDPIEVAAPKPAAQVQETAPMAQQMTQQDVRGLLADTSTPAEAPVQGGLLGEGGWQSALIAGLMSLGDGLRGGSGAAGLNFMLSQQQQQMQNKRLARQDKNDELDRAWRRMAYERQLRNDERDQSWKQTVFDRQTRNDAFDQDYRTQALRIQEMNANKQTKPDVIKAMEAAGVDPQSPEGQQYLRQKYLGGFGNTDSGSTDRAALAASLGVPLADVDPYADTRLSPKGRENLYLANQKAAEKRFAEMAGEETAHREMIGNLERFRELNKKFETGGKYGAPVVGSVARTVAGAFDNDAAEMQSITAKIAPNMRPPGSGATSDYDARQFERATVGIDKPQKANENIAAARIAASQQALERGAFERAYFEANGHTQGADRAWKQYLEANPIFDPKGEEFTLNAKRTNWREFFGKPKAAAPGAETASLSNDDLLSKLGLK